MSNSFAPGFLIAMPDLGDPEFFRSVVLLCSHDEQGAFGLVLNNPSNMAVADICEQTEIEWNGSEEILAHIGGPVEPGNGWVIHRGENSYEDSQRVAPNLYISASQGALRAYADDPTGDYLLCLGYAGWGAGQLEAELASGSWITSAVSPTLIYGTEPHLLWRLALAEVGINVANLVSGNSHIN
jgi:putative transcriptional regulator